MENKNNIPVVFAACLNSWEAGRHQGVRLDLSEDQDIRGRIEEMIEYSPVAGAENWFVASSENCGKMLEGTSSIESLEEIGELYRDRRKGMSWETLISYCDYFSSVPTRELFLEAWSRNAGADDSLSEWGRVYVENTAYHDTLVDEFIEEGRIFVIDEGERVRVYWNR